MSRLRLILAGVVAAGLVTAGLAGCVVGPDYRGPPVVAREAVEAARFPQAGADAAALPPPSRWWKALGDPELDRLETLALADSPDLAVAQARLRQSRAGLRQSRANRLPSTQASGVYLRTKGATSLLGGNAATVAGAGGVGVGAGGAEALGGYDDTLQLYDIGFDATWELDLFGGQARAIEGAKAGAQAAEANVRDAEVSLAAEVAQAYVQLRELQQRLALSRRSAALEARLLALTQVQREGGTASELDVERLNDQLQTTRAGLVPLQAQLSEALDRLSALAGRPPGTLDAELAAEAPVPAPPAKVAVGDPAALLRRRPDIRAAERRLQQQSALVGQRTADLFPKVTLLGNLGFGSTDISNLLEGGSFSYAVAPILQWSPFDFGRTRARISQARAAQDEAVADYRRTVLIALRDADSAIARYGRQREDVAGLMRVEASADRAAALTGLRVRGGTASTLDILDAERGRLQAQTGVVDARADLTQDFVSLQKSLGLGWSAGS